MQKQTKEVDKTKIPAMRTTGVACMLVALLCCGFAAGSGHTVAKGVSLEQASRWFRLEFVGESPSFNLSLLDDGQDTGHWLVFKYHEFYESDVLSGDVPQLLAGTTVDIPADEWALSSLKDKDVQLIAMNRSIDVVRDSLDLTVPATTQNYMFGKRREITTTAGELVRIEEGGIKFSINVRNWIWADEESKMMLVVKVLVSFSPLFDMEQQVSYEYATSQQADGERSLLRTIHLDTGGRRYRLNFGHKCLKDGAIDDVRQISWQPGTQNEIAVLFAFTRFDQELDYDPDASVVLTDKDSDDQQLTVILVATLVPAAVVIVGGIVGGFALFIVVKKYLLRSGARGSINFDA